MPTKYHLISGLPRSGSTLLSAVLRQNPRFSAAVASPVASFIDAMQPIMSGGQFSVFFDDATRLNMLRGSFESYYAKTIATLPADPVLFDTNRSWTARMGLLAKLHPQARVICCVRDVGWIIDSIERMLAKNPAQHSRLFNFQLGGSVYARTDALMNHDGGLIGQAWSTLREAWFGEHAQRLVIVPYDHLVKEPKRTMGRLYAELREKPFDHDFNNIAYDEADFDAFLGMPGLHTVRKKVEFLERKPCIPPDIFFKYASTQFWDKPELNTSGVTII
jgi:sulfotransferase